MTLIMARITETYANAYDFLISNNTFTIPSIKIIFEGSNIFYNS